MSARPEIAFVTCADMPKPDSDAELLMAACGVPVDLVAWDADVDWSAYRCVLLRSPWDYHTRLPEFLTWARRVDRCSRLLNPLPVIEWNSHKRYLLELAARVRAWIATAESGTRWAKFSVCTSGCRIFA